MPLDGPVVGDGSAARRPAIMAVAWTQAMSVAGADVSRHPRPGPSPFVLTQLLGLSYAEAAQVADARWGPIRSRLYPGQAALVEVVERDTDDGTGGGIGPTHSGPN